jgi:hypothetical protein
MFRWVEDNFVEKNTTVREEANLAMQSYCVQVLGNKPASGY